MIHDNAANADTLNVFMEVSDNGTPLGIFRFGILCYHPLGNLHLFA